MLLTDLFRWPELSHRKACRNALRGTMEAARRRREVEDAERYVEELRRHRPSVRPRATAGRL